MPAQAYRIALPEARVSPIPRLKATIDLPCGLLVYECPRIHTYSSIVDNQLSTVQLTLGPCLRQDSDHR